MSFVLLFPHPISIDLIKETNGSRREGECFFEPKKGVFETGFWGKKKNDSFFLKVFVKSKTSIYLCPPLTVLNTNTN